MRKKIVIAACLAGATLGPAASGQGGTKARPPIDYTVLHAQVILDHLGFSPGILDGREGQSLTAALKGFQTSRGLKTSGKLDRETIGALHPYRALRPVRRRSPSIPPTSTSRTATWPLSPPRSGRPTPMSSC